VHLLPVIHTHFMQHLPLDFFSGVVYWIVSECQDSSPILEEEGQYVFLVLTALWSGLLVSFLYNQETCTALEL